MFFHSHTVESTREGCLRQEVFLVALFAEHLFLCGICRAFDAVEVNLFGAVCGIDKHQNLALFNLHKSLRNRDYLRFFARDGVAKLARFDSRYHIAVMCQNSLLTVGGGDGQRLALALVHGMVGSENMYLKNCSYILHLRFSYYVVECSDVVEGGFGVFIHLAGNYRTEALDGLFKRHVDALDTRELLGNEERL